MIRRAFAGLAVVVVMTSACASATTPRGSASSVASSMAAAPTAAPRSTQTPATWAEDLATIDRSVRAFHVSPFTIHPESEWKARLADVSARIESASPNEQIALVASLVGLLDTHSAFVEIPGGWHFYGLLPYRFSDGWFVIRAADPALVGDRLVSIGGVPIDQVVTRLTPLVPHDNADGLLEGLVWELNSVEYLNGAGIVADPAHPAFGLKKPDGGTRDR